MGTYNIIKDHENIIRCTIWDDMTESDAESIIKGIRDLLGPDNMSVLFNFGNVGDSTTASRRILINAINSESKHINKIAFYGMGARAKVIVNFIIKGSKLDDRAQYFEKEANALKWLMEENGD